jgi:hypothetical protein
MIIVVLDLGKSPVPSITVAPSRIITPSSFCASVWLDIALALAKAEVKVGKKSRKVNTAAITADTTENSFTLLFLINDIDLAVVCRNTRSLRDKVFTGCMFGYGI